MVRGIKNIVATILLLLVLTPVVAQKHHSKDRMSSGAKGYVVDRSSQSGGVSMIYGVAAGAVYPVLNFQGNSADVSSHAGFKAGIMWGVDLGIVEVVPELWYSTFNMVFDTDGTGLKGAELSNQSLDFPIMVGFDLVGNLRLSMGPTFSLLCNNSLDIENETYEYGRIKGSVGYAVGVSYDIFRNLFIDFRYSGRFSTQTNEWNTSADPYKISMYTFDITAGFRF